jgi:acetolactate decarboxylase
MRNFVLPLLFCLTACSEPTPNPGNVRWYGELRGIMHRNDLNAHAQLTDFAQIPHLYALGAVEGLKGEVLVLDGQPLVSQVQGDSLVIREDFDLGATLLVTAQVDAWQEIQIPHNVRTYPQLESFIGEVAATSGLNADLPFPFLLTGTVASVDWHVINWPEGDTEHTHEKHIRSGLHDTWTQRKVEMLGFYSSSHHAIFTHHTTNMHIHVYTVDGTLSGHADNLELGEGMVLKLPAISSQL